VARRCPRPRHYACSFVSRSYPPLSYVSNVVSRRLDSRDSVTLLFSRNILFLLIKYVSRSKHEPTLHATGEHYARVQNDATVESLNQLHAALTPELSESGTVTFRGLSALVGNSVAIGASRTPGDPLRATMRSVPLILHVHAACASGC
jgi:hypothetical protein